MPRHYAIIGMAHLAGGYPLYYDATNEAGLSMAGSETSPATPCTARRPGARTM